MLIISALVACATFLVTVVVLIVSRLRLRRLGRTATQQRYLSDGSTLSVAEQVWALRAITDLPSAASITGSGATSPESVSDVCLHVADALNEEQRLLMAGRVDVIARARVEREQLHIVLPAVRQAAYYSTPAFDLVLQQLLAGAGRDVSHGLFDGMHSAVQDHSALLGEHAINGADHVGSVLGHVPVLTIATTLRRQTRAVNAGLDVETAAKNGALDIALRGGGAMAGAHIGMHAMGAFVPGLGHAVGFALGAAGGIAGTMLSNHIKERPLREADRELTQQLAALGRRVPRDAVKTFAATSYASLLEQRKALSLFDHEVRLAPQQGRRPSWWPSLAQVVLSEAVKVGQAAVAEEAAEVEALEELFHSLRNDPRGREQLGALVLSKPERLPELGLTDREVLEAQRQLALVAEERRKLQLGK